MYRVAILVDNLNKGGIASVVNNFYDAVLEYYDDIQFDFYTYIEPSELVKKKYEDKGTRVFVINSMGKTSPYEYSKQLEKLLLNNGPYFAIHMHIAYFIWIAARVAKNVGIQNRIGHAHGAKAKNNNVLYKILAIIGRKYNKKYCTQLYACSEKSGEWNFGSNFIFLPNIVSYENICLERDEAYYNEFGISKNTKIIGYFGVFESEKNTTFLVDIMDTFRDENVVCIAAGTGSQLNTVKERAEHFNLIHKFKFIGYRQDGYKLLKFFDVLVAPSYSEGMSMSLLEAQITGTPCVVSKGIPKTNDLGYGNFYYINNYNPLTWKKNIISALDNVCKLSYSDRIQRLKEIQYDKKYVASKLYEAYTKK